MKRMYGKQVSETSICNSSGYWLNPLTEKTQPKPILTIPPFYFIYSSLKKKTASISRLLVKLDYLVVHPSLSDWTF
jgi:hypothetical protein